MSAEPIVLADESIDAIARRVVELLRDTAGTGAGLVDAAEIARRYGVTRSWVYEHADELGAQRLRAGADGARPRLRFDPDRVAAALTAPDAPQAPTAERPRTRRRRRQATTAAGAPLLPVKEAA